MNPPYLEDKISPFRKILKGAAVVLTSNVAIYFFAFVYQIPLSRALGPENLGIYGLLNSLYVTFSQVSTLGLGYSLVYYLSHASVSASLGLTKNEILRNVFIGMVLFSSITSVGLAVSGVTWLGRLYSFPLFKTLVVVISPLIIFYGISVFFESTFRSQEDAVNAYKIKLFPEVLKFLLIPILVLFISKNIVAVVLLLGVIQLFSFVYGINLFSKKISPILNILADKQIRQPFSFTTKKLLRYSIPFFFKDVIQILRERMDTFLIAYIMSSYHLGIYRVAFLLGVSISFIPTSMNYILFPALSKMSVVQDPGGQNDFIQLAGRTFKYMTYLVLPLITFVVLFPSEILRIVFGPSYLLGAKAFMLLALSYGLTVLHNVPGTMLASYAKTDYIFYSEFVAFIVGLGMNIFFIPRYGITGAAFSCLISSCVLVVLINLFEWLVLKKMLILKQSVTVWFLMIVGFVAGLFLNFGKFGIGMRMIFFTSFLVAFGIWLLIFEKEELRTAIKFIQERWRVFFLK